jgi:hypothetical protein
MTYRYLKSLLDVMGEHDLNQKVIIHDTHNDTFHPMECFGSVNKNHNGLTTDDYPVLQFSDVFVSGEFVKRP